MSALRKLEPHNPRKIRIFTVEISAEFAFKENLTLTIQAAASDLTELLANEINRN